MPTAYEKVRLRWTAWQKLPFPGSGAWPGVLGKSDQIRSDMISSPRLLARPSMSTHPVFEAEERPVKDMVSGKQRAAKVSRRNE